MSHWIDGSRAKVRRAKLHLHNLDLQVAGFLNESPYEEVAEGNPDTGGVRWRFHWRRLPPLLDWGAAAGDVIHNLRAALSIAYKAMLCWGQDNADNGPTRDYPAFPSREHWERATLPELRRFSPLAIDIVKASEPYPGKPLHALAQLDDRDKHRILTTVAFLPLATVVEIEDMADRRDFFEGIPEHQLEYLSRAAYSVAEFSRNRLVPVEEGTVVFELPARLRHVKVEPKIAMVVALNEPTIATLQDLFRVLDEFTNLVDGIVEALAAIPV